MQKLKLTSQELFIEGWAAIEFSASWCKECRQSFVKLEKLEKEFTNFKFFSIDVDENHEFIDSFSINIVPTLVILKDKIEVERVVGLNQLKPLRNLLRKLSMTKEEKSVKEVLSEGDKIYHEIKNMPIEMFGLPDQVIDSHIVKVAAVDDALYIKLKASSALPALEETLARRFELEQADRGMIIVRRVKKQLF